MNIVDISELNYSYHSPDGETIVLSDINLQVKENEFLAIVGPSGCGKSTLLSIIAGLTGETDGEVVVNTSDIGYMFQQDLLFEWRSILSNCYLGLEIAGKKTQEAKKKIDSMLIEYGLYSFRKKHPSELSGGMRQRAALIRTLALEPKLLLLDEPFSALDYQTRLKLGDDIGKIIKSKNITAILVTHDLSEAISLADRCIVLGKPPAKIKYDLSFNFKFEELEGYNPLKRREASEYQNYFNTLWEYLHEK